MSKIIWEPAAGGFYTLINCLKQKNLNVKTMNNGSLGSCIDEERSESR